MIEKLDLYDVLTALLHGVLFMTYCCTLFPSLQTSVQNIALPESVLIVMFVATAYFIGQTLSVLSNMLERPLFLTWGGKPSDITLKRQKSSPYINRDTVVLALEKLRQKYGDDTSTEALFAAAMTIARSAEGSLSERHNRMYAYYRMTIANLILCSGVFALSCFRGIGVDMSIGTRCLLLGLLLVLIALHWFRAKQRAFYFVREVLLVAVRELTRQRNGIRSRFCRIN